MEQRSEARVPHNIRFFVHVHECREDPEMVGVSVACEAVDFSPNGLQFRTDQPLLQGSLINITIGIGEPFAMFLLRGEIRWIRQVGDTHAMGILLQDESNTDYEVWQRRFAEVFSA